MWSLWVPPGPPWDLSEGEHFCHVYIISSSYTRSLLHTYITSRGQFKNQHLPLWCRTLKTIPAPRLGALAIEEALKRAKVEKESVQEVYMGSVLPAGMGQAPDRQAALFAGLPGTLAKDKL